VLKRCREEGLLAGDDNNMVQVRVREPKSASEAARYSLKNCVLEAKIMREARPLTHTESGAEAVVSAERVMTTSVQETTNKPNSTGETVSINARDADFPSSSSSSATSNQESDDDILQTATNRFSALF